MDRQTFEIQWIQEDQDDLKTANGQLIVKSQLPSEDELLVNDAADAGREAYQLVTGNDEDGNVPNEVNIDQIAAENLIFMAHDGQMVTEIIDATRANNTTVVVATSDEIDCSEVLQQTGNGFIDSFVDTTPQMVTEEVITDDWVQHQGEER